MAPSNVQPTDLDSALEQLRAKADQLNQHADEASREIARVNAQLAEMNIGAEFWSTTEYAPGFVLGYAKVDGRWQLATRGAETPPKPLISAERGLRALTPAHLAGLLKELADRVEAILAVRGLRPP